ncbi:MAG: 4-phosphoerythronate dehydrogenase [Bacteroidota bacterium]
MINIVADDKIPFLAGAFEGKARIKFLPGRSITREHLTTADALITRTRTWCDRDLLDGTTVKLIASATIGYDHIDTAWCEKNNIAWTNAPASNADSVKQYVASALAFIAKQTSTPLKKLTLGIIGAGNIGSRVQQMGQALGMNVLVNDPPREEREGSKDFTPLAVLLEESDIITLHVPLVVTGRHKTNHLVKKSGLSRLKKGAWLINTSRGEVVQTEALITALQSSKLSGTVLDVWENEPNIDRQLVTLSALATPHIAGYSADGKANGTAMCVRAVSRFFNLGLDSWFPTNIPAPSQPHITLQCNNATTDELFTNLALHTYDIASDSQRLKANPANFESFREQYPARREPHAFDLTIHNCNESFRAFLRKLGFVLSVA